MKSFKIIYLCQKIIIYFQKILLTSQTKHMILLHNKLCSFKSTKEWNQTNNNSMNGFLLRLKADLEIESLNILIVWEFLMKIRNCNMETLKVNQSRQFKDINLTYFIPIYMINRRHLSITSKLCKIQIIVLLNLKPALHIRMLLLKYWENNGILLKKADFNQYLQKESCIYILILKNRDTEYDIHVFT